MAGSPLGCCSDVHPRPETRPIRLPVNQRPNDRLVCYYAGAAYACDADQQTPRPRSSSPVYCFGEHLPQFFLGGDAVRQKLQLPAPEHLPAEFHVRGQLAGG